jgi:hypothetical protein
VTFEVRVGTIAVQQINERYADERSVTGRPSRVDFLRGPLAAARVQFERFDRLPESVGVSVRHCHVLSPGFPLIVFVGLLTDENVVEIVDFSDDPEYWTFEDPDNEL